jgi:hypothetical protein
MYINTYIHIYMSIRTFICVYIDIPLCVYIIIHRHPYIHRCINTYTNKLLGRDNMGKIKKGLRNNEIVDSPMDVSICINTHCRIF